MVTMLLVNYQILMFNNVEVISTDWLRSIRETDNILIVKPNFKIINIWARPKQ